MHQKWPASQRALNSLFFSFKDYALLKFNQQVVATLSTIAVNHGGLQPLPNSTLPQGGSSPQGKAWDTIQAMRSDRAFLNLFRMNKSVLAFSSFNVLNPLFLFLSCLLIGKETSDRKQYLEGNCVFPSRTKGMKYAALWQLERVTIRILKCSALL